MSQPLPVTIKSRLQLIIVISTGIALLSAFGVLIWNDTRNFRDNFINDLEILAHLVGSNTNAALLFHDNETAQLTLKTLEAQPHVLRAIIFDQDNKIFAEHQMQEVDKKIPQPDLVAPGVHSYGDKLAVVSTIRFDEESIGRLYILAGFEVARQRLIRYSVLSVGILLMSLLIAYLFGNRLIQSITFPIFRLGTLAEKIAKQKDFSIRAEPEDIYELSLLAQSFNQMLNDIESSHTDLQTSEQRLALALDASGESLWEWDLISDEFFFDERIQALMGLPAGNVIDAGEYFKKSIHADDREEQSTKLSRHLKGEVDFYETECRMHMEDTDWVWVHIRGKAIKFDDEGRPTRITGTYRDVTERKVAEEKIQQLAKLFDITSDGVIVLKPDLSILTVNDAFVGISGYTESELVGKPADVLFTTTASQIAYESMRRSLYDENHWQGEYSDVNKQGDHYIMNFKMTAVAADNGEVSHYIGVGTDITDQRQAEKRLIYIASHDSLTGLPNRRLLMDRLDQSIKLAKRKQTNLAVVFFDLDRFKQINDSLGHEVGDELLIQTAGQLSTTVRESDTVARMGGDEFVLILEDVLDANAASIIARNIISQFEGPFMVLGHELRVTPSLGICVYPENGSSSDELIRNADTAMFSAKNMGRNNFQYYTPEMNERALGRLTLENHLRVAIERDELSLHYQPKFDCRTEEIIGAEALLRWNHPELGFISPADFIPLAEETGLIIPIGQWVLERAIAAGKSWLNQGLPLCPIAVNISPLQFRSTDLPMLVGKLLDKNDFPAKCLELELTEGLVMDFPEKIILHLQVLKAIGVQISIDDFGTGYSSLSYLQQFPIDTLKIDRSFISGIDIATQQSAITSAIIAMAHNLGLKVIAEGVETIGQLEFLQNLGCHHIQGYLFSKPIPEKEFIALLRSKNNPEAKQAM